MDHASSGESRGRARSIPTQIVLSIATVLLLILVFKVIMAPPERRSTEVCYPTYKVVEFFRVTLVQAFLPQEPTRALEGVNKSRRYYYDCKATLDRLPGFGRSQ